MNGTPEQLAGGLWGLLVGDALGVPYEFSSAEELPPKSELEMEPPPGFLRSHGRVKPGTWSDDGAQALCLLASLLHCGQFDPTDFGHRLVKWLDWGYMAVGENVFDVGIQTGRAIDALRSGVPALEAGGTDERSNGNGSLMRVLPLALWHRGSDEQLVADAHLQSRVTHAHLRSQICCALYCLWARRILHGQANPWMEAVASLRRIYAADPLRSVELETQVRPDDPGVPNGTGYVVDALKSARWAIEQGDYEAVVKAAVSLGEDTDTTACIAGGVAGVRDGAGAIPDRWRSAMRDKDQVTALLAGLLKWHGLGPST